MRASQGIVVNTHAAISSENESSRISTTSVRAISLHASARLVYASCTEMSFTVELQRSSEPVDARAGRASGVETLPAPRAAAVTLRAAAPLDQSPDERPTDPAPPVHSFWIPKFPKDPGLPDVARLYEEALAHARAVESGDVPGQSTFRTAPVLRHQYRSVRLPACKG